MEEQQSASQLPAPNQKPSFFEKLTNWELWPSAVLYAPLAPIWAWYSLRAGSFWFFTPSNPTIPFGGYEGETKTDVYKQMPEGVYPRTILVKPPEDFEAVKKRVSDAGFQYPFIVKPDVGRKGLLFRKIDSEAQLLEYHLYCPMDYVVQDLIDAPGVGRFLRPPPSQTNRPDHGYHSPRGIGSMGRRNDYPSGTHC